jgi:AcrR family transcriptional regulator
MSGKRPRFVPPDPPITPKASSTRRVLIGVATELFLAKGYEAVSMQDIAVRAEITKGGVYGHFRSKGQLLVEVIRWRIAAIDHDLVVDAVRQSDNAMSLMLDERRREIRLLEVDAAAAARHDPEVAAGLRELYDSRLLAIGEAATGAVSDPEAHAWLIVALSFGIGAGEAIGIRSPTVERFVAALRDLVNIPEI